MRRSSFGLGGQDAGSVSILGLGCSQVGSFGNPAPDNQVRAVLRRALDLGVSLFDTADIYGQGDSEREIGRLLKRRRGEAFVVTKLGKRFSPKMRALAPLKPVLRPLLRLRRNAGSAGAGSAGVSARREGEMREDFAPARFATALHASLRRLQSDYVDALLLHSPSAEVCRRPEVATALQGLKTEGKIRFFGVSCDDLACMRAAADMPGLGLIQVPLDVFDAAAAAGLNAGLAERGVGLLVREVIRLQPGLAPDRAVAETIVRPDLTCAIVGTSRADHLEGLAAVCR